MTRHFQPPLQGATRATDILVGAARCWREARDSGRSIQPALAQRLARHDCAILAPVLDSLIRFYESALDRAIAVGDTMRLSEDEHLLIGLIDGSRSLACCIDCPDRAAGALDCALCSTRIMLALTLGQSPRPCH